MKEEGDLKAHFKRIFPKSSAINNNMGGMNPPGVAMPIYQPINYNNNYGGALFGAPGRGYMGPPVINYANQP